MGGFTDILGAVGGLLTGGAAQASPLGALSGLTGGDGQSAGLTALGQLAGTDPWSALYGVDAGPMQAQTDLNAPVDPTTGQPSAPPQQAQAAPAQAPQDQANTAASQAVRNIQGDLAPPTFAPDQPVSKTAGPVGWTMDQRWQPKDQSQVPQNAPIVDPNAVLRNTMQQSGYSGGGPYNVGSVPSANRMPPPVLQATSTNDPIPALPPLMDPTSPGMSGGYSPTSSEAFNPAFTATPTDAQLERVTPTPRARPAEAPSVPPASNANIPPRSVGPPLSLAPPSVSPNAIQSGQVPGFIQNIMQQLGNPQSLPQLIQAAMRVMGQGGFPGPGQGGPLGMIPWAPGYGPGTRGGYGTYGRNQPSWWTDRQRGWTRSRDGGWERRDPSGRVVERMGPRQTAPSDKPAAKGTTAAKKPKKSARTNVDRIRTAMADEPLVPPENFQLPGSNPAPTKQELFEDAAHRIMHPPQLPWGRGGPSPWQPLPPDYLPPPSENPLPEQLDPRGLRAIA